MKHRIKNFFLEKFIYLPALAIAILTIIAIPLLNYFPGRVIVAEVLAQRANTLLNSGNKDEAFLLGVKAYQIEELNPIAHDVLVTNYLDKKDYNNVIRYLEYQLEYRPNYWAFHCQLGIIYLEETGQVELAKPKLERSVELQPNNLICNQELAIVYAKLGQRDEYFLTIKRIMDLDADMQEKLDAVQKLSENDSQHWLADVLRPGRPVGYGRQTSAGINSQNVLYLLSLSSLFPQAMVVSESNDMGQTWEDQKLLYVGENLNGTLVADSDGIIHILFGERGGPILYTNSSSSFTQILTIAPKGDGCQMAVDLQGMINIVWYDENKVYYSSIIQEQTTPPVLVADHGYNPDIANGENGDIVISYNSDLVFPDPQGQVYLIRKPKDGDWQIPQKISTGIGWAGAASILYSKANHIYLSYLQGQDNQHIQIKLLELDAQGNRVNEELITDEATVPYISPDLQFGGRTAPAMGLDGNGNLMIAWRTLANSDILFRKFSRGVWSEARKIGNLNGMLYDSSPSFIERQNDSNEIPSLVLWAVNDQPVIYLFAAK
jgi:tetratricopeptide (TPR) repeat protein